MGFNIGDKVTANYDLILRGKLVREGSRGEVINKWWNRNPGAVWPEFIVEFRCGAAASLVWGSIRHYVPSALEQLAEVA